MTSIADRFRELHQSGSFVIPNPFDVGSARLLEAMGFSALATTSSGFASTLGRLDMSVTRDELVHHVASIVAATNIPVNVDAERCYSDDLGGIAETVDLLAEAGAAGISIEDWDPVAQHIDDFEAAVARVGAAATAARARGVVLTARSENHLHGVEDLDDTCNRLRAYINAGAEVVYAPGLSDPAHIAKVVALGAPVNVLLLPHGPSVSALAELGVRRVSVGGTLAAFAQGAMVSAAQHLLDTGSFDPATPRVPGPLLLKAFAARSR